MVDANIYLRADSNPRMHDSEPETIVQKTKREEFREMLQDIGIQSEVETINTEKVEKDDYYSKYFTHTPSMVTNLGCLKIKDASIDLVQIIQKG